MTRIMNGIEQEPGWCGKPTHPIREALLWLCGKQPPKFIQGYDLNELTDSQKEELQDWAIQCVDKTKIHWATGIGMLDAAEAIVEEAVSNGNIPAADSKWRTEGVPASYFEKKKKRKVSVKKKKSVRGYTLIETFITVLMIGAVGVGVFYGFHRWFGKDPVDLTSMAQNWASRSGYTWQNSTCQVFGVAARCTVKTQEIQQPVRIDCDMVSKQCSPTRVMQW
jgi:hypothetical protein